MKRQRALRQLLVGLTDDRANSSNGSFLTLIDGNEDGKLSHAQGLLQRMSLVSPVSMR